MIIKFLFLLFPIFLFSTSSCVFTTDYKNVKPKTETYTQSIDEDLSFEMISVITEDLITLGEDVESVTKQAYINSFSLAKYELSYNIYYKIRVWAEENGYKFENKGSEGAYSKASGNDTNALFFANEGGKLPVDLGFYDMAGNSYEWTFDFSSSYDWKYDIYSNRTYRGGTFQWDVSYFEAGYRPLIPPYVKSGGIRLARNY